MSKLLVLSIMIAMLVIPTRAARDPKPKRGLKRAVVNMLLYGAFYAFAMIYLWGRW